MSGEEGKAATLKQSVFVALDDLPDAHGAARAFGIFLLLLIVANALLIGADMPDYDSGSMNAILAFNIGSTAVFAIEYALRLWTADIKYPDFGPVGARLRYATSAMGIIDLLSFLPMLLVWLIPHSNVLVEVMRIIRLVRLVKVSRYMSGLKTIAVVFRKGQREIVAAFMVVALVCIASSVLMYEAEHSAQPEQFDSVFTGIYWAMTTMTSTGYGDLVPITPLGRFIGFVTMALSIAVIAIPAGIFSAGFVAEFRNQDRIRANRKRRERRKDEENLAKNTDDIGKGTEDAPDAHRENSDKDV